MRTSIAEYVNPVFQEYEPKENLKELIRCFWYVKKEFNSLLHTQPELVFPSGSAKVMIHLGDPLLSHNVDEKKTGRTPQRYLLGPLNKSITIQQTGIMEIIGVKFYPWGLQPFLQKSVTGATGKRSLLVEIFREYEGLLDEICQNNLPSQEAVGLLEYCLEKNMKVHEHHHALYKGIIQRIVDCQGVITVEEIVDQACLSRRQLERSFKDYIGLNPVGFIKIVRFQNLLRKKLENMDLNLMFLAHECGYSDQAHFSREFKELIGVTPSYYFSKLEYVNSANQCLAISMF